MSRQDKATTERNTRTLRELVKRPENKLCADCKHNDPRWASWNLGVYLCIRCSGIHRGMGTHISKVKSIDLDTWTPEQMQHIEKWGNRLANIYWEAHLKAGHVPPDHKMESFIRSKYESRRWAMDGPPPQDPSALDNGASTASTPSQPSSPAPQVQGITASVNTGISRSVNGGVARSTATPPINRQPQAHQLLSTAVAANQRNQPPVPAPTQPAKQQTPATPAPENDLFSLDFHAPPVASSPTQEPKKDVKQDILSLFSAPAQSQPQIQSNSFGQFQSSPWADPSFGAQPAQQAPPQPTSMIGTTGAGAWGTSSGWGAPAPAPPAQGNLWGNPAPAAAPAQQKQPDPFGGNVWGGSSATSTSSADIWGSSASTGAGTQKKDDAFGDIWGSFK